MLISQINLNNLADNFLAIRKKVGKAKIMAVVKANAYGHGAEMCIKKLYSLGAKKPDYFAVAFLEETEAVLKLKIKTPILVLEPFNNNNFKLIKENIIPTIFNLEHLKLLNPVAHERLDKKIKVHVKINTGMNDTGVSWEEALDFIKQVKKQKNLILDGVYSHFAASDEADKTFADLQLVRFKQVLAKLKQENIDYGLAHMANSGAILDLPESYFDLVRPGISLYGLYPSKEVNKQIKLKPVMSLISEISNILVLKKGESTSYGRKFIADKNINIAVISAGYADGIRRNLSGKMSAIINNKVYPQIGRIQMDKLVLNLGQDNAKIGDRVVLLGGGRKEKITADDWAKSLDTINYEITCGIGNRAKRVYI